MRRTIAILVSLMLLASMLLPLAAQAYVYGSRTLKQGMSGDDVKQMQVYLIDLKYLASAADGVFGPLTKTAVTNFQKANGLRANGTADVKTQLKIRDVWTAKFGQTPTPTPPPEPTPTPAPASTKLILGYYPVDYVGDKTAYNSLVQYGNSFNAISTFTYKVDSLGSLAGTPPADGLALAKEKGIKAYALVHNYYYPSGFDSTVATNLLSSSSARQNLINQLKTILPANGYSGVNIDIEAIPAAQRANYSQLIQEVKSALGPLGYQVICSVPGKTYNDTTSLWGGAFDFAAIGQSADYVQIMTYDEHWFGGTPGPVASIGYVTKAAQYAVSVIPKEKVLLGVAAYGYDWYGTKTNTVTYPSVANLLKQYGITPAWDDTAKCYTFKYVDGSGIQHEVWYEDARSTSYKLDLVNQLGLGGIGVWRLGFEDQTFWEQVTAKLK